tara:strand:- start:746 stop:1396 length:651 start_codon:yes stop_codon:yes gene_type:complete
MLDMDDVEDGLFAPSDSMSDRERKLTTSLSGLRELTILITNQLGSIVDPEDAVDVKAKKQKGEKDDMLSGQNVGDKSTLGNRSLPRHAAKPGEPKVYSKPKNYLTKSKDFTGDSINKEEELELEDSDTDKFLGLVSLATDDTKKALDSNEVEMLGLLKTAAQALTETIEAYEKKNRTSETNERDALTPQDRRDNMRVPRATQKIGEGKGNFQSQLD